MPSDPLLKELHKAQTELNELITELTYALNEVEYGVDRIYNIQAPLSQASRIWDERCFG